jgi:hypothetical protein
MAFFVKKISKKITIRENAIQRYREMSSRFLSIGICFFPEYVQCRRLGEDVKTSNFWGATCEENRVMDKDGQGSLIWCADCNAAHEAPLHNSLRRRQPTRRYTGAGPREWQKAVGLPPRGKLTRWFSHTLPDESPERPVRIRWNRRVRWIPP